MKAPNCKFKNERRLMKAKREQISVITDNSKVYNRCWASSVKPRIRQKRGLNIFMDQIMLKIRDITRKSMKGGRERKRRQN